MGLKLEALTKLIFQKLPTYQLNLAYHLFSKFYHKKSFGLIESFIPRILPSQRQIETKAATKLAQVLNVIKIDFLKIKGTRPLPSVAERQEYRGRLLAKLLAMLDHGQLERNGSSIFLRDQDIQPMAELIEADAEFFQNKAASLKILRSIIDDPTKLSYLRNEFVEFNGEQYTLQHYRVITKDGMVISLTMLVDGLQVTAGDQRPSIVLVPGIACNGNAFNLDEKYSLARDLARLGYWVYLFEPRGMGRNKVSFDRDCSLDTLIDDDLPSVVDFVYKRSKGKPLILLGHSMGGLVAEFMLQLWSHQNDQESLAKVKGLITLGSPKSFDKNNHLIYPLSLWLNYILPFLKVDRVPMDDAIMPLTRTPLIRNLFALLLDQDFADLNFLVNPVNLIEGNFMLQFIKRAVENFPLGVGFQFQKAIYTGKGITRMDQKFAIGNEKYNYTSHVGELSPKLPVCHFLGEDDPLGLPKFNNFSKVYRHSAKQTVFLGKSGRCEFGATASQMNYFIVPHTKHIDVLYGKSALRWVHPLVFQAIEMMWALRD